MLYFANFFFSSNGCLFFPCTTRWATKTKEIHIVNSFSSFNMWVWFVVNVDNIVCDSYFLPFSGDYSFDPEKQKLLYEDDEQLLTHRESELLTALSQNINELTDRSEILNALWGNDDFFNARSMDVFISKLRKRLAKDPNIQIINVRGYGYKLVV